MFRQSGVIVVLVCLAAVLVSAEIPRRSKLTSRGDFVSQITIIDRVPYTVQLRNSAGNVVCAGTLISSQHVLTAAHCFDKYEAADITVVAGATSNTDTGVQRAIEKLFKHETYNAANLHNDAAVLKLQSPVEMSSTVAALNICSKPFTGTVDTITVAGWSTKKQEHLVAMPRLALMSQQECIEDVKEEGFETEITSSMVCNDPRNRFACEYISGGPGKLNSEVCAILVGGPGCANSRFPGIYTSVYEVRDFIEKSVKA